MFGLDIATVVAVVAVSAFGARFLFKKDTEVEQRRLNAIKVAGILRENGLSITAGALEQYGVGDYSGLAVHLRDAAIILTNPAAAQAEFDKVFDKMLQAKLAKADSRKKLQGVIDAVTKPAPAAE